LDVCDLAYEHLLLGEFLSGLRAVLHRLLLSE
jgi:hypothetical protein